MMSAPATLPAPTIESTVESIRLDYLDAVRAFALLLGIVFHASLSFMPIFIGWAVMDVSTSPLVTVFILVSHAFRMEVFFLIAGFFARLALQRKGTRAFVGSRVMRLAVPFVVGWFILRPLIVSGWTMGSASLRGDVDIAAGLRGGFQSLATLPAGLFTGSHLWFLYYLVLITAAALMIRALVRSSGAAGGHVVRGTDALMAWLAASPLAVPVLVVPTAAVVWFMRGWGVDTPDQALRPHVPVLLLYGGFFAVGWMLHRNTALLATFTRVTIGRCLLAVASLLLVLKWAAIQSDPGHPHYTLMHAAFLAAYATMMWMLVLLTIGTFRRLCARPNRVVRYVADSSYWMYLIHLPVVVWLQVAVAELPLPWWVKIVMISSGAVLIALLTYDLVVRSTFLGRVLNGRRRERVLWKRARARGLSMDPASTESREMAG